MRKRQFPFRHLSGICRSIGGLLFAFILGAPGISCSVSRDREIIYKPLMYDTLRMRLSREYLDMRYGIQKESPTIKPEMVVIHHTVIPTMQATYETFYFPELSNTRPELRGAGSLNVSSHYLVDRDGTIYRLMADSLMARHVIGLNHCAIGIENVGGTEDRPLTRDQLRANRWLIKKLEAMYDLEYLIGHDEYTRFEGHDLWLERDTAYRTKKTDPGKKFMRRLRRVMKNGTFKPLPK